ncbi:MAG: response regulator transcription factor [Oscillospiraceae bacterium]|nr:response regulator transcription factor [Oscillospiraceae bacterium]
MRIAICDDDRDEICKIQDMIFAVQGNYRVDQFQDGKTLLDAAGGGAVYDLLFCDIYMRDENGIDVARRLLEMSPRTAVVFFTASREHAVDAFSVDALHYLVKPVRPEDITEVFRRLGNHTKPRHTLTIRIERTVYVLYQDEIVRIESNDHNTVIICANATAYSIRKPFREISEMMDDSFLPIKKGVTVNMRYISKMTYRDCTMRDGHTFLLRRDRAKELRETYYTFLTNELEQR